MPSSSELRIARPSAAALAAAKPRTSMYSTVPCPPSSVTRARQNVANPFFTFLVPRIPPSLAERNPSNRNPACRALGARLRSDVDVVVDLAGQLRDHAVQTRTEGVLELDRDHHDDRQDEDVFGRGLATLIPNEGLSLTPKPIHQVHTSSLHP